MANKKNPILEFKQFTETVEKGLQVLEQYENVMERVELAKEASAKATKKLNKLAEKGTLQSKAINGNLTITQTLMGVYNGQITAATATTGLWAKAQAGLNAVMNANPIGVITVAVGALIAGIGAYAYATESALDATEGLTAEQKKAIEETKKMHKAYVEMENARQDAMSQIYAEYGYYGELKDELLGLVDTNGKVKDGYEDRANFIVNQFSNAMGMEKEQILDLISSNGDLEISIDKVLEKKKAEALLMANEQAYTDAIRERGKAFSTYQNDLAALKAKEEEYNATRKAVYEYEKIIQSGQTEWADAYYKAHKKEIEANDKTRASYNQLKKDVKKSEETYVGYLSTIQNYEGLSAAILSGESDKMGLAMQNITASFITAETGTKESLKRQVDSMKTNLEELANAVAEGTPGITDKMVTQAQELLERAEEELKIAYEEALPQMQETLTEFGITVSQSMLDAISLKEPEVQDEILKFLDQIKYGEELKEEELTMLLSTLGLNVSESLINTLASKEASVQEETIRLLSQINSGTVLKKEELAALFNNLGIASSDSLINSLAGKKTDVQAEAINLLSQLEDATGEKRDKIIADLKALGIDVDNGLIKGMETKKGDVGKAAGGLGTIIDSTIRKVLGINSPSKVTAKLGRGVGKGFVKGIKNYIPEVKKASEDLAVSALQGMDVQKHLAKMRSAMSMEKAMIGANLTSRVVHEYVMGNQSDFVSVGEKIEALQRHMDNIKIQLQLEGKTYIDKREAGYILAPEINKRLGEFAELKGRGNNSR